MNEQEVIRTKKLQSDFTVMSIKLSSRNLHPNLTRNSEVFFMIVVVDVDVVVVVVVVVVSPS